MKSLEEYYIERACECKAKGDMFGYHYWMHCAFEVSAIEESM